MTLLCASMFFSKRLNKVFLRFKLFEFTVAYKYLVPRKNSISTALISLMSVLVISLVVWLVLIFLSVTEGIEKNWLQKLTTLHSPIRICPTEDYYQSDYYKVDSYLETSRYTSKTIGEKAESQNAEISHHLFQYKSEDLVKRAFEELDEMKLCYEDYEISGALLQINRESGTVLSQMSYLLSKPERNPNFDSLIIESKPFEIDQNPVILPKSYQKIGVKVGDTGTLGYAAASLVSVQEQRIPIIISGFYDPGLVSLGNKCVIVPKEITRTIHAITQTFSPDGTPTNGIFIWCKTLEDVDPIKAQISKRFEAAKIGKYWKIDTYRDFEFSKDLMQQFQSDRTLFLLIAVIILIVACCNIISLLVLMVNDKKKEIGILQAMGASFKSIALIFATCGAIMGGLSCLLGSLLALFTLKHLDIFVSFLSALQGHHAFNPVFFGQALPNQLSTQALIFVLIVTPLLSIAAGLIPALKASRIRSATILRGE